MAENTPPKNSLSLLWLALILIVALALLGGIFLNFPEMTRFVNRVSTFAEILKANKNKR